MKKIIGDYNVVKKNCFKKNVVKVGDKVKVVLEHDSDKRYVDYIVTEVLDKGKYNMYLCGNGKTNVTVTDMDFFINVAYLKKARAVIGG